jgi:hypothetical protein
MNTDRASAYYGVFDAKSRIDALQNEFVQGSKVIAEEAIPGIMIYCIPLDISHFACMKNALFSINS